jgi:hypothetical protein
MYQYILGQFHAHSQDFGRGCGFPKFWTCGQVPKHHFWWYDPTTPPHTLHLWVCILEMTLSFA